MLRAGRGGARQGPSPTQHEKSERAPPAEAGGGTHLAREPPPVPRRSGSALHTDEAASVSKEGAGSSSWGPGGDLHPQPPTGLRPEEWCPPPELKAPWAETLPGKLSKLCVFRAGHRAGPGESL